MTLPVIPSLRKPFLSHPDEPGIDFHRRRHIRHVGSKAHYPEEAPVPAVTVGSFWMDLTPSQTGSFVSSLRATGYLTVTEIPPDPKDDPGANPRTAVYAGSLVFTPPPHAVDLRNWKQWWRFLKGANWRHPYGPKSNLIGLDNHPVVHIAFSDAVALRAMGLRGPADRSGVGVCGARRA